MMAITRKIRWAWKGIEAALGMDNAGNGPTVILGERVGPWSNE
jgi:hypothetical protein